MAAAAVEDERLGRRSLHRIKDWTSPVGKDGRLQVCKQQTSLQMLPDHSRGPGDGACQTCTLPSAGTYGNCMDEWVKTGFILMLRVKMKM